MSGPQRPADPSGPDIMPACYLFHGAPRPLLLRCTCRTDSEAQMPATFRSAVSARLAHDLTLRWAKSLNRAKLLGDLFQRDLIAAKRADRRSASATRHDGLHIDESAYWSREAVR